MNNLEKAAIKRALKTLYMYHAKQNIITKTRRWWYARERVTLIKAIKNSEEDYDFF